MTSERIDIAQIASPTVDTLLANSVERFPDGPVLSHWGGATLSYAALDAAADRLAQRLAAGSVATREHVGIIAPNVPALVVAMFAAWRAGAVVVPLNSRLREYEIRRILHDAQISRVLSVGADRGYSFASLAPQLVQDIATIRSWTFIDSRGEVEDELTGHGDPAEMVDIPDIGAILYTSGTTGTPKGALAPHARELAGAQAMATVLGLAPDDTVVFIVPISHAFGLTCLLSTIASGAHAVLVESTFSLEPAVEAIRSHQATILHGSPAVFTSFLKISTGKAQAHGSLRGGFVAGAACPSQILEELDQRGIRILNLFGMTEVGAVACCRPNDPPTVRYTTSGRALPGYEVRVVPHEGVNAPAGELQVRGRYVTPGYYRQPEATAQAFTDGWFRTGDIGSIDAEGRLSILGRIKEVIHVAGLNVFPAEVEGFLLTHPDIQQAVVIGVPHQSMGEALHAFVVPHSGAQITPTAVLQFARQRIAGYKLPYAIEIVSELPLLSSGKPDRTMLVRKILGTNSTSQ